MYARHGWIQNEVVPNGVSVRYLGSIGSVRVPPEPSLCSEEPLPRSPDTPLGVSPGEPAPEA